MKKPANFDKIFRRCTVVILFLLLFAMPLLSLDYGITIDEPVRVLHGIAIVKSLGIVFPEYSRFPDLESLVNFSNQFNYYGGSFDSLTAALHIIIPSDLYNLRHIFNALIGWLIIVYTARLATMLYGPKAGLIAVLLMLISPRFIGHSMNNPKDIPFAAFFIASVFYMLRYSRDNLIYKHKEILLIIVFSALCLSIRPGALLLLCYLGCVIGLLIFRRVFIEKNITVKYVLQGLAVFTIVSAAVPPLGSLLWPYAIKNPYINIFKAMKNMSNFYWDGYLLYNGKWLHAMDVPWHYIPAWIAITTPLIIIVFFILSAGYMIYRKDEKTLLLMFFAVFPVVYVIIKKSTLYDGWRHLFFIYPMLVVISCAFLTKVVQWSMNQAWRGAAVILLIVALSWHSAVFMIAEHPNQVVYFNQIIGGTKGALYRFELDYWGNSMKQAAQWIQEKALTENRKIRVFPQSRSGAAIKDTLRFSNLIVDKQNYEFTFIMFRNSPEELKKQMNDPHLVHAITVNDAPICLIFKSNGR